MEGDMVDTTLGAATIGFGVIVIGASQPVMSSALVLAGAFLVFMGTRDL